MSVSDTALLRAPRARLARPLARVLALLRRIDLPIVAIVAIAFLWVDHYTSRVTQWGVMTDELQYARLALSIGDDHTLVPHIHGQYVHIFSQLYPLVLAPFYQLLDMASAYKAAHVLNALSMASTAIPAYLLARELTGRRLASYAVGALSVAIPWMVLSTLILTEVFAYPVFAWTAWAIYRAVVDPSTRRDVVAVVWLVLAFFARTQFVMLWAVPPLVLLIHELGYRGAGAPAGRLRDRLARIVREHRVLTAVYALALVGLVVANLAGGVSQLLGNYAITTSGQLFPNGMSEFMRTHLAWVAVGIGIVPMLLAVAWAVPTMIRPLDRRAHAFATLLLVTGVLMTVQVSSFTLRFTVGPSIEDRYLFFMVPLVMASALACMLDRRPRTIALLVTGGVAAYLIGVTNFEPTLLPFFASPDAIFHKVLTGRAWEFGYRLLGISDLTAAAALRWGTLALAIAFAAAMRWAPRRIVMGVTAAAVLVWGVAETTYTFRQVTPPLSGDIVNKQWADHVLPSGATAAMVPSPQYAHDPSPIWWEIEMWNKKVTRAISFRGDPIFTPFPATGLDLRLSNGGLHGPEIAPYLIFDTADIRFRPEAVRPVSVVDWRTNASELIEARRPWRADWATVGFASDGWGLPGHHTQSVRVYGYGSPKGRMVGLTLSTQGAPGGPGPFVVRAEGRRYTGRLTPAGPVTVQVPVCVRPPQRFVDVAVSSTPASWELPIGGSPRITVHLDRVSALPDPGACAKPAAG